LDQLREIRSSALAKSISTQMHSCDDNGVASDGSRGAWQSGVSPVPYRRACLRAANDSAGKLRAASNASGDAARPLPRLMMHSAGAIATDVTPSQTPVQELQLRASVSAVRQLHLQVLRGVRFRVSFVPTSRGKACNCNEAVVAVDSVSPRRRRQHSTRTASADALASPRLDAHRSRKILRWKFVYTAGGELTLAGGA